MKNWSGEDWVDHGSRLSGQDPWLAQRIMSKGIKKIPDNPIVKIIAPKVR